MTMLDYLFLHCLSSEVKRYDNESEESFIERIVATDEFQKMQQIVKWIV